MPAGIQAYNESGTLVFDSSIHKVLKLYKVLTIHSKAWTYDPATGTESVPVAGIKQGKHVCLPFGQWTGTAPTIFAPFVRDGLLCVQSKDDSVSYGNQNHTIYILEV